MIFAGIKIGALYIFACFLSQFTVDVVKMGQPAKSKEMSKFLDICFPDFFVFFSKFLLKDVKSYVLAYEKRLKNDFQS